MVDRPTPWTASQARVVAACDVVAAVVIGGAARWAAGRDSLADQVVWIDLAVLALIAGAVANGCLLLVARRAIGARRMAVLPDVVAAAVVGPEPSTPRTWWWVPGTARAHVEGCPLVAGKPAEGLTAAAVRGKGLQRCEVCG
jgi:hypothetical protein